MHQAFDTSGSGTVWWTRLLMAALTPVLAVAATLGLTAPLISLALAGVSPVGMTEESTGYRYFYSLRLLYAANERPWLPQGQIVGIVHQAIQLVLTALGYPPTEITPRIVLFGYVAAVLPHIATGIALWWTLRAIPGLMGRAALAAATPALMLAPALTWGYHLLLPDYYSWIHTLAVVSLGCCLRLTAVGSMLSVRWAVRIGLLLGAAAAVKVTVVTLALPPLALLLLAPKLSLLRRALWLLIIGVVSAGTYLLALLLYYQGDTQSVVQYFTLLRQFSADEQQGQAPSLLTWALDKLVGGEHFLSRLFIGLPVLLGVNFLALRPRTVSFALGLGAAPVVLVVWRRPLPTTEIEAYDYLLLALSLWTLRVGWPAVRALLARLKIDAQRWPVHAAGWTLVLVGLVIPAVNRAMFAQSMFVPSFRQANQIERALSDLAATDPGRIAIVTLGNSHRPVTLDSAIFKGGTNLGESDSWGVSPFMLALFPNRSYFYSQTDRPQRPIDPATFDYLYFVSLSPPEQIAETRQRLAQVFHLSLIGFDCPVVMAMPTGGYQYGCKRRPDGAYTEQAGQIAFIPDTTSLAVDAPVAWASGPDRPLRPGEAVYAGLSRELWRLASDGSFTRVRGTPGQQAAIGAIGPATADGTIRPLTAQADGPVWTVDSRAMTPANPNPGLRTRGRSTRPDDWTLLGGDQVSFARRQEEGVWLELRASATGAPLGVQSDTSLGSRTVGPLTAVISVRGFSAGTIQAQLTRTRSAGQSTPADELVLSQAPDGDWQTLVLRLPPSDQPGDGVRLSVSVPAARAGDRLDIRSAAIYSGRYP